MNSLALSSYFALGVILLALWSMVMSHRAPPSAGLTRSRPVGRSIDILVRICKRKLQRDSA